jgi:nucleotide-binding universal stress UspA family protein
MVEIKKIVAVVNLSSRAVKTIEWAKTLATLCSAELVLFYDMSDIEAMKDYANLFAFPVRPDVSEEAKKKAEEAFKKELKDFNGTYRLEFVCCNKDELIKFEQKENPDLVLLPDELYTLAHKIKTEALIIK